MTDFIRDDVHGRTLTAFFDTRAAADQAISDLEADGVPRQHISRVDGGTASSVGTNTGSTGFWDSLKDMFMPDEDRHGYAEGLQRGGFLVSVKADEANYTRVTNILDRDGAIDMDEREASWRKEGWTGYARGTDTRTSTGVTSGLTTSTTASTGTTAATTGALLGGSERKIEKAAVETRGTTGGADYIPIVEERLSVGKRDVSHGRVRLRSYVVETPVQEQVSLHDERVQVDHRKVDRPVTAADEALFADKTIELEEFAEEAVVAKEARVVEEVALRKEATDRTETIRDTVRSTKVDIDDGRTTSGVTGSRGIAEGSNAGRIVEHMEVYASDGTKVGTVDHMDGPDRIKLAKSTSPDGQHHLVPLAWVDHVDQHVHLNKTVAEMTTSS